MSYRSFRDEQGKEWEVWAVVPGQLDRRSRQRRTAGEREERRGAIDRRLLRNRVAALTGLQRGWLCFEHAREKRRLAPIPADWPRCDDRRLEQYCREATVARRDADMEQGAL